MTDRPHEYCGLFAAVGVPAAAEKTYFGLFALQHRGQESAGIAIPRDGDIVAHRGMGLVGDVFKQADLDRLASNVAVGHVRYSTTGSSNVANAQPLVAKTGKGPLALAHNGNLVNSSSLRAEYEAHGSIFQTSTDSEVILHLLAHRPQDRFEDALCATMREIRGAFSLLLLTPDEVIAIRDPQGFRPLVLGSLNGGFVVASETCAFDLVGAKYLREVEPGEMVFLAPGKPLRSMRFVPPAEAKPAHCIFEHVYFSRPDSRVFGDSVHAVRRRCGEILAEEHPAAADLVMPIPDSGTSVALGFARASGLPFEMGLIRNHYVGRTFIQPTQGTRAADVGMKLNLVIDVVRGKRVVILDDSIIRGTTSRAHVRRLRAAGAREVHMRIGCPPVRNPCHYGIDFPTRAELIAAQHEVPEIAKILEVDSLGYLSLEGLLRATSLDPAAFCTACYSGKYPVPIEAGLDKFVLERR